ncbi:hypothetical protein [Natronosalvus vescus]|uniref:hypothetical protein n=1 Tax=Natronosalvus vescus TaxID=2953881 RepID=UPI0020919548|nr:hypothetical protein [Natronosalvus vescus]
MQTLEVTDEQYAVIQRLRAAISADVVGKYGFVREQDAVQFLIDNLDGDLEAATLVDADADEVGSTATDDVAAAVEAAIAGEETREGVESVSYEEGEDVVDEDGESVDDEDGSGDVDDDEDSSDGDDESADDSNESDDTDSDESDDGDSDGDTDDNDESADDSDESEDTADSDGDDDSTGGAADDDDMLDRMMNLLETHDDKWEESPSGDYRYRVTLPDGSTDDVQTKDDVRALLFKNY